ncbi:MFS general substrate transporter [Mytilinidion resinicola]|uniref:MFS general substrate transporter n=1 Tax=Mytilinidion resinicola TaxID=574789 RepID=A0A6A6Y1M9_9PEZI|nr:MFS general substrate transporter [Mytilinidion resinicola]KAF2802458.1 MFS general substrate transporter [Mytilinidion resinicola]
MSTSQDEHPTEQSPLLGDPIPDNGSIERGNANGEDGNGTPIADDYSTSKAILTLASIWMGVFLAAADGTMVATLAAPISNSFHSLTLLSWVASSYYIANAALQPLSGRLTDIFSRRTGLVFSNIFFAAGNLICGLATKQWVVIFGRVVAGMGGGGLTAISTFVTTDIIPLRNRGLWQGFGNLFYGLGMGVGGVLGGWISDTWGWRNAFLIQVPFIVVSCALVWFTVKIPVKEKNVSRIRRVDFLGAGTLVVSVVLLLLGLNSGGNVVPWTHPLVLVSLPLSAVFLGLFIYVEDRVAAEPIIPVRLLVDRTVACGCLTNWFCTMSAMMITFYVPVYFQARGLSSSQAGARIIPTSVGAAVGSLGAGYIIKATGRYYILNAIIEAILVTPYILIAATFSASTPVIPPLIYLFLSGVGYGGMLTVTLLAFIAAVDHEHQAVITSASYAFRSTGSTIGITIASAVFQNVLKSQLWATFGNEEGAAAIIARIRDSIDEVKNLPPEWKDAAIECYMTAFRGVWGTALGIAVLGAAVSLGMKEHFLHTNLARK